MRPKALKKYARGEIRFTRHVIERAAQRFGITEERARERIVSELIAGLNAERVRERTKGVYQITNAAMRPVFVIEDDAAKVITVFAPHRGKKLLGFHA